MADSVWHKLLQAVQDDYWQAQECPSAVDLVITLPLPHSGHVWLLHRRQSVKQAEVPATLYVQLGACYAMGCTAGKK